MIYILKQKTKLSEFIFSGMDVAETIFYPPVRRNPFIHRIVKAIYYKMCDKIYLNFFPPETSAKLSAIKSEDTLIVVGEDIYTYWVVYNLCKHVKYKVAYFWNPKSTFERQKCTRNILKSKNKAHEIVSYIRNLGYTMATFDYGDALAFNMRFFPQFYRFIESTESKDMKYYFFFCGRDKGRKDTIEFYKEKLTPFGKCKFVVMSEGQTTDPIPYNEYVEYVKNSRVLCEAVQKNQIGLTVRSIEALFFNKKLITNNAEMKKYDIYVPNNVLIIDSSIRTRDIEDFLNKPMVKISDIIKKKYDVNTLAITLDRFARE